MYSYSEPRNIISNVNKTFNHFPFTFRTQLAQTARKASTVSSKKQEIVTSLEAKILYGRTDVARVSWFTLIIKTTDTQTKLKYIMFFFF